MDIDKSTDSYYIEPFMDNEKALREDMNQHVDHNYPLTEKQKHLEGRTRLYGKTDWDYDRRR